MESPLNCLVGQMITSAEEVHDYVQIGFGEKIGISIYNKFKTSPASTKIDKFVGKNVASVAVNDDVIEILTTDGSKISIDMTNDAWQGPEALQLDRIGFPTVVWN
jgi:hypothetical protein